MINIKDEQTNFNIILQHKDLFITGDNIGDSSNTCYVALFRAQLDFQKTYQLGNLMTKDYYLVFDMTPYDERNENYI